MRVSQIYMELMFFIGTEQVEGSATSDIADDCTSHTGVGGEGAEAEGRLHGDEQVPQRGTELRCRVLAAVR